MRIAVIDYGMGNLRSVSKALEHVAPDADIKLTHDAHDIEQADRIVFPGQGAARDCMRAITRHNLVEPVLNTIKTRPFLGICMGLQVLLQKSEENHGTALLGAIPGQVMRFAAPLESRGKRLKIPHMGWNKVHQTHDHPLWQGIEDNARFYFVHSYYVQPADTHLQSATTDYGPTFTCALAQNNLFAVQFHPEKSARAGLALLKNFVNWNGQP